MKSTQMKLKQIAVLIAGMSASAVALANPVTVAQIDAARANGTLQQAWLTGASAPTRTVYEGWVRGCAANTNTIFSTQGGAAVVPGAIGNYSAYACVRGGRVSVLYHSVDGGSLNAYTPHTIGTVMARIRYVGTGNGCGSPLAYVDPTNAANNATVFKGCGLVGGNQGATGVTNATNAAALAADPNAPQWPVGGYSDVEASLFPAAIGGGDVSARGTESNVGVGQVFAVAASIPLYRAMQVAQGLTQNDDPANAPNITHAQYVSLIAQGGGSIGDWTPILGSNPGRVCIARRPDTSGTQAASNAFFLQNPCADGVGAARIPTTSDNNITGAYEVVAHAGTGNVKTALTNASNSSSANDRFAIGIMSAENNWREDPAASAGYRYLRLDGVHPEAGDILNARVTAANGQYKFHMEMKDFVRADYAGRPAKTAFEAAIIGEITAALKTPPVATCAVFPRGLTINPLNFSECTVGAQVARMTNEGNNCAAAGSLF